MNFYAYNYLLSRTVVKLFLKKLSIEVESVGFNFYLIIGNRIGYKTTTNKRNDAKDKLSWFSKADFIKNFRSL